MKSATLDPPSVESLVATVVDEFLDRQRRGEHPDVDEYARRYPQLATLLRSLLPTLRFMQTPESGSEATVPVAPTTECLGDYRLVRVLGRGGMGIVYEAEQLSLHRRVALKVLPFAAALDPLQLQRFKNEAQAAAHLQHPRIVPVYAVGCEQGTHYFAMQYIEGQSLANVLRQRREGDGSRRLNGPAKPSNGIDAVLEPAAATSLHALETAHSIRDRNYQRAVARLGMQAAEALEHAHRQGVIHRDIKPANLLLDRQGALWLTDFGLARFVADHSLTQSGDVIGTFPYMSPEQATAQRDLLDQRTDVYALGATLYELLTLEPPFGAGDRQQVLRQIAEQDPRSPRSLNPSIPADLETIVLKALEKNPADRYATAQALAEDLRRFLDDQPIQARRPSLGQRVLKWSRRHRTLAVAGTLCLVLAVGLFALSTLLIWEHHLRTQDAYEAKLREQSQVRENLDQSLHLLEEVFLQAAENRLLREPERDRADQEMLEKGLQFYQHFVSRNAANSAVRSQTAQAHLRVAYIQQHLGRLEEAEKACDEAVTLCEVLTREHSRFSQFRRELATALHMRAAIRFHRGHAELAATDMQREEELLKRLVDKYSNIVPYQCALAACRNNRSLFLYNCGQLSEADALLREFLPTLENVAVEHPHDLSLRQEIATARTTQGHVLASLGETGPAERAYLEASRLVQELAASCTKPTVYELQHASLQHRLAVLLGPQRRVAEARRHHESARAALQKLVADFPNIPDLQMQLAEVNDAYGRFLAGIGEPPLAETVTRQAVTTMARLTQVFPDRYEYRMSLATAQANLGELLLKFARPEAAEQEFCKAAEAYGALSRKFPQVAIYQHHLAMVYKHLARVYRSAGDFDKAQAFLETALNCQRSARRLNRSHAGYRDGLCNLYESLVRLQMDREDHAAAMRAAEQLVLEMPKYWLAALRAARAAHQSLEMVRHDRTLPSDSRAARAREYEDLADRWWARAMERAGKNAEAQDELARHLCEDGAARPQELQIAVGLAQGAVKNEPRRAKYWLTLGSIYSRLRDWPSAIRSLNTAWRLDREASGEACFVLAMAHWHQNAPEQAQFWYRRGLSWMRRHGHRGDTLRGAQVEAAALLGRFKVQEISG